MKRILLNEIIRELNIASGKYSFEAVFSDWVQCMALAIQNSCTLSHDKIWNEREEQYKLVMNKYDLKERNIFIHCMNMLVNILENEIKDVLGEIYMKGNCGSSKTGQFFTPFHISELNAAIALCNYSGNEIIELNEPSVGGGGMIIATAKVLYDKGINYQRIMKVVAQDLDWRSVYMSYVQFSFLGIKAVVVQGNTLLEPYNQNDYEKIKILKTPAEMGVIV